MGSRITRSLRPWTTNLATLAIFLSLLYILFQFLASTSLYRVLNTSSWTVWKDIDYNVLLPKPISPGLESSDEIIEKALSTRPTFRGFQNKTGMLNPVNWRPEFKTLREDKALNWAVSPTEHTRNVSEIVQPPFQFPGCLVHINHAYRFIWIKGKKVGGTTIREPLGWICGDHWRTPKNANMEFCSERWYVNKTTSLDEARQYWDDYFVFGFIRNPYSRYGSSYTYVNGLTKKENRIPFGRACRQPFLQALKVLNKSSTNWFGHHVHHIMEQSSCLFTQEGLPAVDFVGETEFLHEDLKTVLDEINKRKPSSLPDLKIPNHLSAKNANHRDHYAVSLYTEHPKCVQEVEEHFWMDFELLGYEFITKRYQDDQEKPEEASENQTSVAFA